MKYYVSCEITTIVEVNSEEEEEASEIATIVESNSEEEAAKKGWEKFEKFLGTLGNLDNLNNGGYFADELYIRPVDN